MIIELPWPPTVNHFYRRWKNQVLISAKGREYVKEIERLIELMESRGDCDYLGKARLSVKIYVNPPDHRKRDIENLLKVSIDSLEKTGRIFDNDEQIDFLSVARGTVENNGKFIIRIEELPTRLTKGEALCT